MKEKVTIDVKTINGLWGYENLTIPDYQRPYKWNQHNISTLLNDIENAIIENGKYSNYRYRIGTIILHKKGKTHNIVDGQQRIISLLLIKQYLDKEFCSDFLKIKSTDKITQKNIYDNYAFIKNWFSVKTEKEPNFNNALENTLEVIVICVENEEEAFRLFDSQNTRGRALYPHDLLKAYHLREMNNQLPFEKERAVVKWEAKDNDDIKDLFNKYLYPIMNWSREKKTVPFTSKRIEAFKGIEDISDYTYAKRVSGGMPYFQIPEPFVSGNDFFEMVDYYLDMLEGIEQVVENDSKYKYISYVFNPEKAKDDDKYRKQFKNFPTISGYPKELFYCALLCYYDRFHNFDDLAVKKMFTWALMIRVDMDHLGFSTINKYAVGGENNSAYTNGIAMFSVICRARRHNEISELKVSSKHKDDKAKNKDYEKLYKYLQSINGEQ